MSKVIARIMYIANKALIKYEDSDCSHKIKQLFFFFLLLSVPQAYSGRVVLPLPIEVMESPQSF